MFKHKRCRRPLPRQMSLLQIQHLSKTPLPEGRRRSLPTLLGAGLAVPPDPVDSLSALWRATSSEAVPVSEPPSATTMRAEDPGAARSGDQRGEMAQILIPVHPPNSHAWTLAVDLPRDATAAERASLKARVDGLVSQGIRLQRLPELVLQTLLEQRQSGAPQSDYDVVEGGNVSVSSDEEDEPPQAAECGDDLPLIDRRPKRKAAKKAAPLPPMFISSRPTALSRQLTGVETPAASDSRPVESASPGAGFMHRRMKQQLELLQQNAAYLAEEHKSRQFEVLADVEGLQNLSARSRSTSSVCESSG